VRNESGGPRQFADVSIGRADFLCMQKNGVVTGYLNKGPNNMVNQGLIKHDEGKERISK